METFRFFAHYAGDPYFNMAFDEWMFARCTELPGAVFARLYSWETGTITFGLNQREALAIDHEQLNGTPLIRRVTGGRAVYHDEGELTYCVAMNDRAVREATGGGSVSRAYTYLAECLCEFLERLGTQSELVERPGGEPVYPVAVHKAPCFASAARYELRTSGHKVVASAQRQIDGTLVQHGSIKLAGVAPHPALPGLPGSALAAAQRVAFEQFDRAASLWRRVMSDALRVDFDTRGVSEQEAQELRLRSEWTRKNSCERRDPIKQTTSAKSL